MEDDYADGTIDAETFSKMRSRYKMALSKLGQELKESGSEESEFCKYLKSGISALEQLQEFYQRGNVAVKRAVFGSIFSEKDFFDKNNCRTTRINEAVRLILSTSKGLAKQKTGQLFMNLALSGQVEVTGIEPVSKHILQKLSTCLFPH